MKETIVVFNLKTTGTDLLQDEIIEIGAWRIIQGRTPENLHFFTRPQQSVSYRDLKLTGINKKSLSEASYIDEHFHQIFSFFKDSILVSHNLSFDMQMVEKSLDVKLLNRTLDTFQLSKIFFPRLNNYKLNNLVKRLEIKIEDELYGANKDSWATWKVLEACWLKGLSFDLSFYHQAERFFKDLKNGFLFQQLQNEVLHSFPDRQIRTDIVLATSSYDGLFENNEVENYTVPEHIDWVVDCFKPQGILEKKIPGYEHRTGQVAMAEKVALGLSSSVHVLIEAGTGIGKSFAYIVPSLWWAKKTGKKVVVATYTIPLQEQIKNKDIPVLETVLPFKFKSVLLKGRNNYCCLKKWQTYINTESNASAEERLATLSILVWLRETTSGDFLELPQMQGMLSVWAKINAETNSCVPSRCAQSGMCFLMRIRKEAEQAELIVVNHSLLFSNVKTDNKLLPDYSYLIIDEAHNFHKTALEQLGIEISLEKILKTTENIFRPLGPSLYGNLKNSVKELEKFSSIIDWNLCYEKMRKLPESSNKINEQSIELFRFLKMLIGEKKSFRFILAYTKKNWWNTLNVLVENLIIRLKDLSNLLTDLTKMFLDDDFLEIEEIHREISIYQREVEGLLAEITQAFSINTPGRVTWLEQSLVLYVKSSPLEVSKILEQKIFSHLDSVILTSATISISGSFEYFLKELGLSNDTLTLQVNSPFDYENQMKLFVVKDILRDGSEEERSKKTANFIAEAVNILGGRTLVLFTSHQFLRMTYLQIHDLLGKFGIETFAQGINGGREAILEHFLDNSRSVLLGANSFWEGIDIPGEALSCVIIVKLPFPAPSVPLVEARSELLESNGRNPFSELFLPEAVIRFKQGFGRLIRTFNDRGIVILLDGRVAEKSYGSAFLSSLPVKTHIRGESQDILRKLESWFFTPMLF